jgi:hypothetical protein
VDRSRWGLAAGIAGGLAAGALDVRCGSTGLAALAAVALSVSWLRRHAGRVPPELRVGALLGSGAAALAAGGRWHDAAMVSMGAAMGTMLEWP